MRGEKKMFDWNMIRCLISDNSTVFCIEKPFMRDTVNTIKTTDITITEYTQLYKVFQQITQSLAWFSLYVPTYPNITSSLN